MIEGNSMVLNSLSRYLGYYDDYKLEKKND